MVNLRLLSNIYTSGMPRGRRWYSKQRDLSFNEVKKELEVNSYISVVSNQEIARLFSALFKRNVAFNKTHLKLDKDFTMIVGILDESLEKGREFTEEEAQKIKIRWQKIVCKKYKPNKKRKQ